MKVFLDAKCFPPGDGEGWAVVRTVDGAIDWVLANGFPDFVSFNNDLGKDATEGNEFAFWLTEHDLDAGAMPDGFGYDIRGQSPVGDDLIRGWIDGHLAERAAAKAAGHRWPFDRPKHPFARDELATNNVPDRSRTKAPMSDKITFDDCCRIILEQGPPRHEPVAPDKPDYRRDLLALLNKEFGIDWNDNDGFQQDKGVPAITRSLTRDYACVADPFAGWLEYTPVKGEEEVWDTHQARVSDAATELRQRFVAFFRDLLLLRWPEAAQRTTSWTRLRAFGLVVPKDDPCDL
jgi:hypothetical protein